MKIDIYKGTGHGSLPPLLDDFYEGVKHLNPTMKLHGYEPGEDVAVFVGAYGKGTKKPEARLRDTIAQRSKKFICIESPLIGRGYPNMKHPIYPFAWYRVGINGFLADTGNFNNSNVSSDRWDKIKDLLNVEVKPWKKDGKKIVLACQNVKDASLRGSNHQEWIVNTIREIRKHSDREIVVRTPQSQMHIRKITNHLNVTNILNEIQGITLVVGTQENLFPMLEEAHATVTYTSGFSIDSVLAGVPNFSLDPGSFVYELGNNDISNIENPIYPDREEWLHRLSYAQWSSDEIRAGEVWKHLEGEL